MDSAAVRNYSNDCIEKCSKIVDSMDEEEYIAIMFAVVDYLVDKSANEDEAPLSLMLSVGALYFSGPEHGDPIDVQILNFGKASINGLSFDEKIAMLHVVLKELHELAPSIEEGRIVETMQTASRYWLDRQFGCEDDD